MKKLKYLKSFESLSSSYLKIPKNYKNLIDWFSNDIVTPQDIMSEWNDCMDNLQLNSYDNGVFKGIDLESDEVVDIETDDVFIQLNDYHSGDN
jgi:hypothetical protein